MGIKCFWQGFVAWLFQIFSYWEWNVFDKSYKTVCSPLLLHYFDHFCTGNKIWLTSHKTVCWTLWYDYFDNFYIENKNFLIECNSWFDFPLISWTASTFTIVPLVKPPEWKKRLINLVEAPANLAEASLKVLWEALTNLTLNTVIVAYKV